MAVDHNNPQSRNEEILIATIDGTEYNKLPQSRMEELLLELKETIEQGGGGGTSDYENLTNQPQVNGETLIGDKTGADLGLVDAEEGKGLSTNDYDDTEKAAVAAATSAISAMKDGTDIDSFGDVEIALLDKADISDLGTAAAKDSTNAVTSGSTDLVESGAVKDAIDSAVSSAYHHAGTKTVAQLTHDLLIAANEGNVYNITDSGTTTSDFIEGIGKTIDEGSNVGICKVGDVYMFDLLSGFVDTSNFVQKSVTAGLLKNDGTVDTTIQGDVGTLKSGLTTLDNEVNGDATTYPYADVITISDAIPSNLADCSVKIDPVQDLHGYDHPWVGGAGKNKLPLVLADIKTANTVGTWSGNAYTLNGVTFTVNTDNDGNVIGILVNGTAVRDTEFYVFSDTSNSCPFNDMLLNGCINGSNATYDLRVSDITTSSTQQTTGDGEIINVAATGQWRCTIMIRSGYAASNLMFYPMIRLSTESDATFAPYTNICPISGHTEASVQRDGKNKWNGKFISSSFVESDTNTDTYRYGGNTSMPIVANKQYVASINGTAVSIRYAFLDADKNRIGNLVDGIVTTIAPINAVYMQWRTTDSIESDTKLQIEDGTSATPYVPYAGKTYTIALGDTIYGGTVDFDSGVMTVTHGIVDVSTLSFQLSEDNRWYTSAEYGFKHVSNNVVTPSIMDRFPAYSANGLYNDTTAIGFSINQNGNLAIRNGSTVDTPTGNLCYELATPTTIQLTPQQIQLLKGQNTLTASTGDISVTVNGVSGSIGQVQTQANATDETLAELAEQLPDAPTTDGAYVLTVTVADGTPTYSWESAN